MKVKISYESDESIEKILNVLKVYLRLKRFRKVDADKQHKYNTIYLEYIEK